MSDFQSFRKEGDIPGEIDLEDLAENLRETALEIAYKRNKTVSILERKQR